MGGLLLVDGPRYALSKAVMFLWDALTGNWPLKSVQDQEIEDRYEPSVCVVLAGYNEAETVEATLTSIWGTYPRLEIIVIDDGSEDDMHCVAQNFAQDHAGILVLRKPQRGGKSSCINFALKYTEAEIVVVVDTDSHLAPDALWEIVQPLADPQVGAVSATVLARNTTTNLITWLQAEEYLHSIFVGRMLAERLGIVSVASGAFGAFRREAVQRVGGWDVGPGEDGDITLRLRKMGYDAVFAPYAECFTNVPESWPALFRQRRRWNRGTIRYKCRKHVDMAFFWYPNFRFSNLLLLLNVWFFNIVCLYGFWIYVLGWLIAPPDDLFFFLWTTYVAYLMFHVLQVAVALAYSRNLRRDAATSVVLPFVPIYQLFRKCARLISVTEELFFRRSFDDNYVPWHVREATWHW